MAGTDDEDVEPEVHGRLINPGDEDVDTVDDEKDAVGSMVEDEDELSAEEAAMHITEEP